MSEKGSETLEKIKTWLILLNWKGLRKIPKPWDA